MWICLWKTEDRNEKIHFSESSVILRSKWHNKNFRKNYRKSHLWIWMEKVSQNPNLFNWAVHKKIKSPSRWKTDKMCHFFFFFFLIIPITIPKHFFLTYFPLSRWKSQPFTFLVSLVLEWSYDPVLDNEVKRDIWWKDSRNDFPPW